MRGGQAVFLNCKDVIKLDIGRDDAISLFNKSFYDMHKAGYTFSTRIIHADYNGKKFTGVVDDNGVYTARYIGNVENDRYYRTAPISKIEFDGDDNKCNVKVKTKANYYLFFFIISLIVLIAAVVLLVVLFNTTLKIPFIAITDIAFVFNIVILVLSKKTIDDAQSELLYILKYKD